MMQTPAARAFRIVGRPEHAPLVEALLSAQGFIFEPEAFYPLARRLASGGFPLGSSLAARFGYIYIQDRSSMLPPLALAPPEGAAVLDMCASPGSKTGLLALLTGENGFVMGNEPSQKRLGTLRRNLKLQNLFWTATSACPGERLPLPDGRASSGWSYIQLDPPCSGWGTVEKNPQVLRLWQGDKLKTLIGLQRKLLREAARLLRPGGRLVYSTCTTNAGENEEQVRYAREQLGLNPVPLGDVPGFSLSPSTLPGYGGYGGFWRVDTGADGQGFFVALLEKGQESSDGPSDGVFRDTGGEPGLQEPHVGPATRDWEVLPSPALASEGVDVSRLPPGTCAVFNGTVYFLPEPALRLLPRSMAWKGFSLGRLDKSGRVRVDPWLRDLMPSVEEAGRGGYAIVNVDEPEPVTALLTGQSMRVECTGGELGLYFRGLPLCRLTVKGRRAMLPPF